MKTINEIDCTVINNLNGTWSIWPNTEVYPKAKQREQLLDKVFAAMVGGRIVGSVIVTDFCPLGA